MSNEERIYHMDNIPEHGVPEPGKEPQPWTKTNIVGKPLPRVDAYERVSGTAIYPSDVTLPNMLYGVILGCPHANAKVKKVDTSKASRMAGVKAIISSTTKGMNLAWSYKDKTSKIFNPHCRFEGDAVAAVAAETPYQAWDAAAAVEVGYQVLPFISDETEALDKNVPKVHDSGNRVGDVQIYERGDVSKGFSEADVVLEQEYRTESLIHTPMELHGCVARWDGDKLTIWESTQGVFSVQSGVAEALNMPLSKVRVIGNYMGGGFGSKLVASKYTIIAALLAKKTGRPVKLFLSREQTYLCVGNRPPTNMKLKAGVKKDGTLTAFRFIYLGTSGAYPAGGISLVDWLVRDLYKCPNVRCEGTDVFINAGPARPFRAPGHPQAAWALEQMMDALAQAIDMDPVDLRLKNVPEVSQADNKPYTTTGLKMCLQEGAQAFKWKDKVKQAAKSKNSGHVKTGVGMAACLWFIGGGWPPSTVMVKLFADGSANLNMGASDIGTGTKTIMATIVAEELGMKRESIQIENADTGVTSFTGPSGGSKTVPSDGPAVREAAVNVKQQLLKSAAEDLKTEVSDLMINNGEVVSKKDPAKKVKIAELSVLKNRRALVGLGYKQPNPEGKSIRPFGAQFCEVRVDTKTGQLEVVRFVAAHESGRIMNRLTYDSQVHGGITMGIGLGTTEMRVLDANQTGKLCNRNWHDYKLPTAMDVPADIVSVPLEMPDNEANIIGAKGLGEPVTIPTAVAIANAVYNATGVRVFNTPINPVQLSRLLAKASKEG